MSGTVRVGTYFRGRGAGSEGRGLDNLRVRLDDSDGVFETDGSDVLVADIANLSLTDGVQEVAFTNDDTNVQVSAGISNTYFLSALTTVDADQQDPSAFCVTLDPDAQMVAEGKSPDFSVSIQDSAATSANVDTADPLAVTLGYFYAQANGDVVNFIWQTATEMGVAGFELHAVTNEGMAQLNETLIPSSVVDSLTPTNSAVSLVTNATLFYLLEVGVDGGVTEHGPFELGQAYGEYSVPSGVELSPRIWLPLMAR